MSDSAKDKIRRGFKKLHPDTEKKDYIPHVAGKTKQLIQAGLEEEFPSVGKDGEKLQPSLTVEQRALAKIMGETEDEYREAGKVGDKDDRSRT